MTREEFHALVDAEYDKLTDLQSKETFYDYEEGFAELWIKLGGQVMQASLDKGTGRDKQKKTTAKPVLEK